MDSRPTFPALPQRLLNIVEVKLYNHKLELLQIFKYFQVQLGAQCHLATPLLDAS